VLRDRPAPRLGTDPVLSVPFHEARVPLTGIRPTIEMPPPKRADQARPRLVRARLHAPHGLATRTRDSRGSHQWLAGSRAPRG